MTASSQRKLVNIQRMDSPSSPMILNPSAYKKNKSKEFALKLKSTPSNDPSSSSCISGKIPSQFLLGLSQKSSRKFQKTQKYNTTPGFASFKSSKEDLLSDKNTLNYKIRHSYLAYFLTQLIANVFLISFYGVGLLLPFQPCYD